jgi:hypothetical protein
MLAVALGLVACRNPIPTVTVEGKVHVVMALSFGKSGGFGLINSNYMIKDGTAFYLWFKRDAKVVGMDRQTKGDAWIIPVPRELGTVVIYSGAQYLARGTVVELGTENVSLLLSKKSSSNPAEEMVEETYTKSRMADISSTFYNLPTKILHVEYFELVQPEPQTGD